MKRKLALILLPLLFIGLTIELVEDWWSNRGNNLHNNSHWIIGKDTGKFLFYTYQFMFAPLERNSANLNSYMGHQEILWHKPETETRRLQKLSFELNSGSRTYMWIPIRKEGQRLIAFRFSYRDHYPSGFFSFDSNGALLKHLPFTSPMPEKGRNAEQRVDIELKDSQWQVQIGGQAFGSFADVDYKNGFFGFRGSGFLRQFNGIDSIRINWLENGKPLLEEEQFKSPATKPKQWLYIACFSILLCALRLLRTRALSQFLQSPQAVTYTTVDVALAPFLLLSVTQGLPWANLAELGFALLLLEVVSFSVFSYLLKKGGVSEKPLSKEAIVFITLFCIIATSSLYRHGDWAGRRQYSPAAASKESFPSAFTPSPPPIASDIPLEFHEPFEVQYGHPFTSGDQAFNAQKIEIEFSLPESTTFDICFQQQSFFTKGDPEGELLPLQRRLFRVSSRNGVTSGLAMQTGREPGPFVPIKGKLYTEKQNRLTILSTEKGTEFNLNGIASEFLTGVKPLGYGEMVLMTYEQPVTVHKLSVEHRSGASEKKHLLALGGLLGMPLLLLLGALLFRAIGSTSLTLISGGAIAIGFPIIVYFVALLFIDPIRLTLISSARLTLQGWLLVSALWATMHWLPLHRNRSKILALPANIFLLLVIAALGLVIWDQFLPAEHPLKSKFQKQNTRPGEMITSKGRDVPWYAINQRIASNLFVWRQQWEGRWIPLQKEPGKLRAFVLGGSQAWGSGAASSRDTFSGLLHQRAEAEGLPIEVLNAGVNGAGISSVNDVFFSILPPYQPDVIILDIGLNDSAGLRGKTNIAQHLALFKKIAETCKEKNIELILVHEPISEESVIHTHDALYEGYAKLTKEYGYLVVDPRPIFDQANLMEMVWWDAAHFAPRGHNLMAEQIFPALKSVVEKRLAH